MKKRNLKSLVLHKKQIATLNGGVVVDDATIGTGTITVLNTDKNCWTDTGHTDCLPSEYRTACESVLFACETAICETIANPF